MTQYTKDHNGNVVSLHCNTLVLQKAPRNFSNQAKCNKMGIDKDFFSYDGGHLVASMFGGSGNFDNLVPMISELNRGNYLVMERQIRTYLKKGINITDFNIKIVYFIDSKTPATIDVTFKAGVEDISHHFINDKMFNIYGQLQFKYKANDC